VKPFLAAALFASCCAAPLAAQSRTLRPSPSAGEVIRVTPGEGEPYTGTLSSLGGDIMVLERAAGGPVWVTISQQPLEVRRRNREHWSGLGALAGGGAAIVASLLNGGSGSTHRTAQTVVGAAGGVLVGGLLGFSVAPQRWQRLRFTPPAVAVAAPPVP
jgi:hypothetical protein